MICSTGKRLLTVLLLCVIVQCWTQQDSNSFVLQYKSGTRSRVIQGVVQQGCSVLREYKQFLSLVVSCDSGTPTDAPEQAAAAAGRPTDAVLRQMTGLRALPNVNKVHQNGWIKRPQPVPDLELTDGQTAARLQQRDSAAPSCALGDPGNPDAALGIESEGVPYGITLTQSDTPEMKAIANNNKNNILWCVIDTGLDITNQEFDKRTTSGCLGPGASGNITTRDSFKYCYNWWDDHSGHGTHTSGTIGALRNNRGVVGVAPEGAHIYHYNIFGPHDQEPVDLTVAAWLECIDELDRRKAAISNPDMKLVISMSFGVGYSNEFAAMAIKSLAAERQDVLWLAAAGNSGDDTMGYPAGYPEVMSVAAVDWNGSVASFSTRNSQVDIAAPGVKTVSTVPLNKTRNSDYYFTSQEGAEDIISTSPALRDMGNASDFFKRPYVGRISGSSAGSVSAPLVDCGLATDAACANATGKICLIQRGNNTFCAKVAACVAGGGVGVMMYNAEDKPKCDRLSGVDISSCSGTPAAGWPVGITLSGKQGRILKAAVATGPLVVKLNVPIIPAQTEIGLAALSGTSMACPTAAGVAGLVWSAHTDCSADQIRQALEKSARKPADWSNTIERDDKYGHGIIQALDAHKYLQEHPCAQS